jgi:hypothetical protein
MNGTNSEVGEHRNNQDNDGLQLSFAPLARWRGGTWREHSVGGHGAQFRFYLPGHCGDLTFPQVVFMGIAPK